MTSGIGGANGSGSGGPSRMQKGKHHITSMVAAAAEAEYELQSKSHSKSGRMTSKQRYGF